MHKHLFTMYVAPVHSKKYLNMIKTYFLMWFTKSDAHYRYKFILNLRKFEYLEQKKGVIAKIRRLFCSRRYHHYGNILGYSIEADVLGPDAHLYHKGNVLIHGSAKIGANVHIHGDCCIGIANTGTPEVPVIGDNVDIGIGAKILGGIYIADNITIGANSVVTKSFYEKGITIAGAPAKRIK